MENIAYILDNVAAFVFSTEGLATIIGIIFLGFVIDIKLKINKMKKKNGKK